MKGYNNSIKFRSAAVTFIAAIFILLSAGTAFCQELTIPYVFSPGNVISSFEMNENFRVLAEKTNSLDSVINNLDASNSFWGYDSGTLTYSGGNVGIGTASPVSPFTVVKNDGLATDGSHILSTIYRGLGDNANAGVSFGYFVTGGIQSAGYIRAEDDLPLMLGTIGAPQALKITNEGSVRPITVSGTAGNHGIINLWADDGTDPEDKWRILSDTGGSFRLQWYRGGSWHHYIDCHEKRIKINEMGENLHFSVESDNLANALFVNGADGNVGLGTSAPTKKLEIYDGDILLTQDLHPAILFDEGGESDSFYAIVLDNRHLSIREGGTSGGDVAFYINYDKDTNITGNLGIGGLNTSYRLNVNGDVRCSGSISEWSDIRYKSDIRTIPNALERVNNLRGVNFIWKDEEKFGSGKQIGIVAQEIEKVFPEAVTSDSEGNKSVTYSKLTAVLIEAVKEQQEQIEALEKRLEAMEGR